MRESTGVRRRTVVRTRRTRVTSSGNTFRRGRRTWAPKSELRGCQGTCGKVGPRGVGPTTSSPGDGGPARTLLQVDVLFGPDTDRGTPSPDEDPRVLVGRTILSHNPTQISCVVPLPTRWDEEGQSHYTPGVWTCPGHSIGSPST